MWIFAGQIAPSTGGWRIFTGFAMGLRQIRLLNAYNEEILAG